MKKLTVLFALFAALALAGCGSDEPKAKTPEPTPQAAPAEVIENNKKGVLKTEKLSDGTIVETKKHSIIITYPDGTKRYKSRTDGPKIESTGEGIHHFSK